MAEQVDIYSNIYTNPYFDLEAVVDDNEEEDLDEDMEDELALFLDDSETIEDSSSDLFGSSPPPEEPSSDEEEIAREIRQRHAKENTPPSTLDAVKGKALFSLAPNREKDAVVELQRIIDHRRKNLKTVTMSSVASYGQYPGQVFVWAIGAQELKKISTTRSYMLHWKISLIEQSEWLRLYAALDDHFRIPVPCWVRIKAGLYKGDLALLERSYSNECCDVLLIPRAFLVGRKRPKSALLTSKIATRYWGDKSLKSDPSQPDWFIAKKLQIKAGLLCRYVSCHSFAPSLPKDLDELSLFMGAVPMLGNADLLAFVLKTMDDIRENDLITIFRVGDRVRVVSGTFSTMEGIIKALEDGYASVSLTSSHPNVHIPPLAIMPISDLRCLFKEGDTICVISGFQKGRKGSIIHVDGLVLTFLNLENRPPTDVDHSSGEQLNFSSPQVRLGIYICKIWGI
ncbi:hypothetical protein NLI96_g10599 [Meripilus lineatus]|uniref:KOW domain-containing protein n=1 Tax=Meripilus lineatus TaxID=2056292 RepID=A0AAD5UVP4_9APHY|nr:hypothetical protein NLI96_g10599 [Physisporinus lineatus]